MKEYVIHFAQAYPGFRKAELESLADLYNIAVDFSHHDEEKPFLIVKLQNDNEAKKLIERSVLSKAIYELWGEGRNLEELHTSVKTRAMSLRDEHRSETFKFDFVSYRGGNSPQERVRTIESFSYLDFRGKIRMKNPQQVYAVIEDYANENHEKATVPDYLWFTRRVQLSARSQGILDQYDLKTRKYIGTTSFEAELSLVSCNIGQADVGKIMYDPFVGTGSFLISASHYGAVTIGSDIDVRVLKGKGKDSNLPANFKQYGLTLHLLDLLSMDFTNNAFRSNFSIDSIVCDPPYGVREGLKVCGSRDPEKATKRENVIIDGEKAHLRKDFIPPKKPYELFDLLRDLLEFAAQRLPVGGRLGFWMPTANDEFEPHQIPQHEKLELLYNLEQTFNKWSRRLLVYVKRDETYRGASSNGLKSSNVKRFRDRYFKLFNDKV